MFWVCNLAVECNDLQAPGNGIISNDGGHLFQNVKRFACNSGYNIKGSIARKCQADETWDGTNTRCERELQHCNCECVPDSVFSLAAYNF